LVTNSLYVYPWDINDLSADVSHIRDLGIDSITLASAYHAGKFIQPAGGKNRVYFPEDGVVYFRPRSADYGKLKPKVSKITEDRDILAELLDQDTISVNAWVVLNHNTRLGQKYADASVQNIFGDKYPYSLCPANPDVRHYARTVCVDISENYPVKSLLLETPGYMSFSHGFHHEFSMVSGNKWLENMLGLCFCDYCKKGAVSNGIDIESLQRNIVKRLNSILDFGLEVDSDLASAWWEADLLFEKGLIEFLRFRCGVVSSLISEIRESVIPEVAVKVIATTQSPHATSFVEGHDLKELHSISDGLELPLYQSSAERVALDAYNVISQLGTSEGLSVILRPGYPDMKNIAQLSETIARLSALNLNNISFYNYGMSPPSRLEWIKTALDQIKDKY